MQTGEYALYRPTNGSVSLAGEYRLRLDTRVSEVETIDGE